MLQNSLLRQTKQVRQLGAVVHQLKAENTVLRQRWAAEITDLKEEVQRLLADKLQLETELASVKFVETKGLVNGNLSN